MKQAVLSGLLMLCWPVLAAANDGVSLIEKWAGSGGSVTPVSSSNDALLLDQDALSSRRWHAWLIGVSEYRDWGIRDLPEVEIDVDEIGTLLAEKYGFSVDVSLNKSPAHLERQMQVYEETLGPKDNLLIFFFGHGWLNPENSEGYWLFSEADEEDQSTFWANRRMADLIGQQNAGQVLLIANSCFTGSLGRDKRGVRQLVPDLLSPERLAVSGRSLAASRSFFAAGGTELVYGRGKDKLSVLGWGLKKVLEEKQGVFGARQLFLEVHDLLRENANQTPVYAELLDEGHQPGADFIFVPR